MWQYRHASHNVRTWEFPGVVAEQDWQDAPIWWQLPAALAAAWPEDSSKGCTGEAAPPVHQHHPHTPCKSAGSRARGALLCFIYTTQPVPYRFYHTRRWIWLGRDDEFLGVFLPFSFIASGYCIFKPVLITLNIHIFTYIYIKYWLFYIYLHAETSRCIEVVFTCSDML